MQTYNDINRLTDPLLKLARKNPTNYQLVGHIIRTSAYPLPWILGDFPRIGYYEKDSSAHSARRRFPPCAGGQDRDRRSKTTGFLLHDAAHGSEISGALEAISERKDV